MIVEELDVEGLDCRKNKKQLIALLTTSFLNFSEGYSSASPSNLYIIIISSVFMQERNNTCVHSNLYQIMAATLKTQVSNQF